MFGFLLQWPTVLTLLMYPILMAVYARLARSEGSDMVAEFGDEYRRYQLEVPAFVPHMARPKPEAGL